MQLAWEMLELAKTILVKQAESITIVNAVDDKDAEVKVRVTTLKSKPLLNTNLKINEPDML